jgi:hypothetical protein
VYRVNYTLVFVNIKNKYLTSYRCQCYYPNLYIEINNAFACSLRENLQVSRGFIVIENFQLQTARNTRALTHRNERTNQAKINVDERHSTYTLIGHSILEFDGSYVTTASQPSLISPSICYA